MRCTSKSATGALQKLWVISTLETEGTHYPKKLDSVIRPPHSNYKPACLKEDEDTVAETVLAPKLVPNLIESQPNERMSNHHERVSWVCADEVISGTKCGYQRRYKVEAASSHCETLAHPA